MEFEAVIGLEIHAQLQTATKIFCGCGTAFGAPPNTQVCPVCLGFPGALPVLNARAVELAVKAALALGCEIQPTSIFARKNYFYPDLPKGYQISQYERPFALAGRVRWQFDGEAHDVRITRVHMEEDAGKSLHDTPEAATGTCLDFNRAGTPLVEIVTEPDIRSGAVAADFFSRLRDVLTTVGANDGNLEEGSLRCDANVSVRPVGTTTLGTKVEIKNLNSFRFVQKAIEYEIARQSAVVRDGGRIVQETRLWDADAGCTESMRSKEEAHDYRYFPEPDLPPLRIADADLARWKAELPELPEAMRERLVAQYGLPAYDAGVLTQSAALARFFEQTAAAAANPKAASNWIMGELLRLLRASDGDVAALTTVTPAALGALIRLVDAGTINGSTAKTVFETMFASGRAPDEIVTTEGLAQVSDEGAVLAIVRDVIARETDAVAQYRKGKQAAIGFLTGQVMKAARGKANPKLAGSLLARELGPPGTRVGPRCPGRAGCCHSRGTRCSRSRSRGRWRSISTSTRAARPSAPRRAARARRSLPESLDPRLGPRDDLARASGCRDRPRLRRADLPPGATDADLLGSLPRRRRPGLAVLRADGERGLRLQHGARAVARRVGARDARVRARSDRLALGGAGRRHRLGLLAVPLRPPRPPAAAGHLRDAARRARAAPAGGEADVARRAHARCRWRVPGGDLDLLRRHRCGRRRREPGVADRRRPAGGARRASCCVSWSRASSAPRSWRRSSGRTSRCSGARASRATCSKRRGTRRHRPATSARRKPTRSTAGPVCCGPTAAPSTSCSPASSSSCWPSTA